MKYFCKNNDREGTGYLEFLPRKWDDDMYWAEDSMLNYRQKRGDVLNHEE